MLAYICIILAYICGYLLKLILGRKTKNHALNQIGKVGEILPPPRQQFASNFIRGQAESGPQIQFKNPPVGHPVLHSTRGSQPPHSNTIV